MSTLTEIDPRWEITPALRALLEEHREAAEASLTERAVRARELVDALYEARHPERGEWADWLHAHHVHLVAQCAAVAALVEGGSGLEVELAHLGGMLHDVADAQQSRFSAGHAEASEEIARSVLEVSGFSDADVSVVVESLRTHSCRDGVVPRDLVGRSVAGGDALAHLCSEFYERGVSEMGATAAARTWAREKVERDLDSKTSSERLREIAAPAAAALLQTLGD